MIPWEDNMDRYKELIDLINLNQMYYDLGESLISDNEFDLLMRELKSLEKEHPEYVTSDSPTQRVGYFVKREAGVKVSHRVPMLSLDDVFEKEDVIKFVNDTIDLLGNNTEFLVETKIDGLSIALRYEKGILDKAITRGDGVSTGEDVTVNVKVIDDVKHKLINPVEYLEIRGEIYMTKESFNKVNERQELLGKEVFANPRNCAVGTLKQLDTQITSERNLSMYIFNIQEIRGKTFITHSEGYEYLKSNHIKVIECYYLCKTADEVWEAIEKIGQIRGDLEYDIDGAVVKLNNLEDRKILGQTSKIPKWAIAYKYPPEEKETLLLDIELNVGRTGRITPTAVFKHISLCGTRVSRATLHNQDFINKLGINVGDKILVYKSGEIIPKIKSVTQHGSKNINDYFIIPNRCPVCGSVVAKDENVADIKCINPTCQSLLLKNILNFASRDCMDIKGFGASLIEQLVNEKYLSNIADIYSLKDKRVSLIEEAILGKEKNTDKLLQEIENSKDNEADRLLASLGIPNIGKATTKELMRKFKSIDNLMKANNDEIKQVPEIGDISAKSIVEFFNIQENLNIINRLKQAGVNMVFREQISNEARLIGKTFVITGTLSKDRKQIQAIIEANGGKATESVSKKTDFIVAGDNAGSKLIKARELGIPVITENELMEML